MRKTLAGAIVLALGIGGALSVPAATAHDSTTAPPTTPPAAVTPEEAEAAAAPAPKEALDVAERVLDGEATSQDPSATIALRNLWLRHDELRGTDRRSAAALLARPTDGAADPQGFGYDRPATRTCDSRVCVWYVTGGTDAASAATALRVRNVINGAWNKMKQMGYRNPVQDANGDGTAQFDVYLKDVGSVGLYGYCAGERRAARRTASGFCVLDNDFSSAQFPSGTPDGNLRVTAAHEFFHAVQFAYDYAEDGWMLESTATWIEERIAGDVNDNRNYLPYSQLYAPKTPLNKFKRYGGLMQYGNWIFWEYLSKKFGDGIVRKAWNQAGSLRKDGGLQSLKAITKVLRKKGTFANRYAQFASDNLVPSKTYREGSAYPAPKPAATKVLTKKRRKRSFGTRLNHLTSASYRVHTHKSLKGKRWKLRVKVNGPKRKATPRARVIVHMKNGKIKRKNVQLNKRGKGSVRVAFNAKRVTAVSVTLVNASLKQNRKRFRVTLRAVKK